MRSRLRVKSYILFQLDFLQEEELRSRLRSWRVNIVQCFLHRGGDAILGQNLFSARIAPLEHDVAAGHVTRS